MEEKRGAGQTHSPQVEWARKEQEEGLPRPHLLKAPSASFQWSTAFSPNLPLSSMISQRHHPDNLTFNILAIGGHLKPDLWL